MYDNSHKAVEQNIFLFQERILTEKNVQSDVLLTTFKFRSDVTVQISVNTIKTTPHLLSSYPLSGRKVMITVVVDIFFPPAHKDGRAKQRQTMPDSF